MSGCSLYCRAQPHPSLLALATGIAARRAQAPAGFFLCLLLRWWCVSAVPLLPPFADPVFAQGKLLPVFRFRSVNGIFMNQVRSRAVRDDEGYVWVGSLHGLWRFDGYGVNAYRPARGDDHALAANVVTAIALARNHRLWVGTYDAGIGLYDRTTDRFTNLTPRPDDSTWYEAKNITNLLVDRRGDLWVASRYGGVVRLEPGELPAGANLDSLLRRARCTTFPLGTPANAALDLCEGENGRILVASDRGLVVLDPSTRSASRLPAGSPAGRLLDTAGILCLRRDSRRNLWVGTRTDGVFLLDTALGPIANYRHRDDDTLSISSNTVFDVAEDPTGAIWIAGDAALDLFSPATGERVPYLAVGDAPRGPAWMRSLSVDETGALWVGMPSTGLHRLGPKSRRFPHYGIAPRGGLEPVNFETIERDREGHRWISSGGKILQVDVRSLTVGRVIDVFRGKQPTYGNLDTFIDAKGIYWYGSWGLGLFRIDLASGRVAKYGLAAGLGPDLIIAGIAQGPGGTLWSAGRYDGLLRFDPAAGRFTRVPDFPRYEAWWVENDSRGRLWVSSSTHGVCIFDTATGTQQWFRHDPSDSLSLGSDRGRKVYEDLAGRIWVGSGNYLHRWNQASGSFTRYPSPSFDDAAVTSPMGADRNGRIWADILGVGLGVLDPATGSFAAIGAADGIPANVNELDTLSDGRLIVTSWEGLHILHPDSLHVRRTPPPLVITRMSVNDEPVARPLLVDAAASCSFPYWRNALEIEFAALDMEAPYRVRYRYQLEGLEQDWVSTGERRFVRYPSLAPGDYVFKVRAVSEDGEWPDREMRLTISISPPWWQTWWFLLVAGGAVLGLLWFLYRREVDRLKRDRSMQQEFSRRQIESQEAERKRLAAELHDGLGQDLLVMSNYLQQFLREHSAEMPDMRQVSGMLQQSIEQVREISSNLHPHQLERLGFCAALEAMAEHLARSSGLAIRVSCDRLDHQLPKETEIHLYRIIQEALSNAVRHASARNAVVEVTRRQNALAVAVQDDGRGFADSGSPLGLSFGGSAEKLHGFGLSSMAERARIIGAEFAIDSSPGSGTTVRLTLPIS